MLSIEYILMFCKEYYDKRFASEDYLRLMPKHYFIFLPQNYLRFSYNYEKTSYLNITSYPALDIIAFFVRKIID